MGSFLLHPEPDQNTFFSASEDNSSYINHGSHSPESGFGEPQETRTRRMLELELMHFYVTETGPSIAFDTPNSFHLFVKAIPKLALKSDALLYSLYAIASLHQTKTSGGEDWCIPSPGTIEAALERHQFYLQLAIEHHHRELTTLSSLNVDAQMLTTHLMRINALVMLSDRSLQPYTPPVEWMRITESNKPIFLAAWELIGDDSCSETAKLIRTTRVAWDMDERAGFDKMQGLQHLLPTPNDVDGYDAEEPEIRRAYESALAYIGGTWQSMRRNEPLGPIGRRLMLFPLLVDKGFIELVGEARPRALVIMAHYFSLLVVLESYWYIGLTGRREVKAIASHLSADWQGLIEWPLHVIENGIPYTPGASPGDFSTHAM